MNWLWVFLGGGLGSVARFGISWLVLRNYSGNFPIATFVSNLLACGVLAIVINYLSDHQLENSILKFAVLVGFCGGFSTFSTFAYETIFLMKNGNHLVAVLNVVVSVVVCSALMFKLIK